MKAEGRTGLARASPLIEVRLAAQQAGALAHQMLAYAGRVNVPVHPTELGALNGEIASLIRAATKIVAALPTPFRPRRPPQARRTRPAPVRRCDRAPCNRAPASVSFPA